MQRLAVEPSAPCLRFSTDQRSRQSPPARSSNGNTATGARTRRASNCHDGRRRTQVSRCSPPPRTGIAQRCRSNFGRARSFIDSSFVERRDFGRAASPRCDSRRAASLSVWRRGGNSRRAPSPIGVIPPSRVGNFRSASLSVAPRRLTPRRQLPSGALAYRRDPPSRVGNFRSASLSVASRRLTAGRQRPSSALAYQRDLPSRVDNVRRASLIVVFIERGSWRAGPPRPLRGQSRGFAQRRQQGGGHSWGCRGTWRAEPPEQRLERGSASGPPGGARMAA
jgi:hypothetical protein